MRKQKNPVPVLAPNAREIIENLTVQKDGTIWAGYRIGPARWDFTGSDAKISRMNRDADVFSHLAGRFYHERVSTRPHPVQSWAAQLDARTPSPTPDVHTCDLSMSKGDLLRGRCGCETWNSHLVRQQNVIARSGMDDKVVFRYFTLNARVNSRFDLRKHLEAYRAGAAPHASLLPVLEDVKRLSDIVSGWPGSRPMTEFEQGWLRVRSLAPGMQPVGVQARSGWDELSIPALGNDIRWVETPFGRTVAVTSWANGRKMTTAARVLTVARLADLNYPENGLPPWQVHAESVRDATGAPFPVEWSVVGRIRPGEEMTAEVELELRKAEFIRRDYGWHKETPPAVIDNGITVALDTRNQVVNGQAMEAARFQGQINVIITGQDRYNSDGVMILSAADAVEERCASLTRAYAASGLRMDFTGADCQSFMLQSTVVGEPFDRVGYQRRLRLPYLAAGMPNATASIGDSRGPYLGHTRGASRRPVMHDPHYATEGLKTGRAQNMHLMVGTLGCGKSVLFGAIAYDLVRRGTPTIINDPSGPLAKLCQMPEIAAVSQEVNLLTGRKGILSPPGLIAIPHPDDHPEPGDWADAVEQARSERRDLVIDMALRCLPEDLVADGSREAGRTREMLRLAARRHAERSGWETTSTLWDLVDSLATLENVHADAVAGALVDASTAPLLRLLFPPRGQTVQPGHYGKTLTVITTPGIVRAVDGTPRRDWNPTEIGADAVLRLTALYTNRLIYSKPREQRAAVFFDEAESFTDFGPGRSMFSRLGRDHSKWNLYVALGMKSINPQMLSGELKNFIASVFVGRMASTEPALEAMAMLGLSDPRYAGVLMNLSTSVPGEWVHRDVDGNVGGMRVDVDYHPALKAALLTDPAPEGSSHWMLDEEML
jgi:hypothetical protein